jgi:hypothetical protein
MINTRTILNPNLERRAQRPPDRIIQMEVLLSGNSPFRIATAQFEKTAAE